MTYRRHITTADITAQVLPFVTIGLVFPLLAVAAYCLKSAMGIDLFEGPSFMHAYFYWG